VARGQIFGVALGKGLVAKFHEFFRGAMSCAILKIICSAFTLCYGTEHDTAWCSDEHSNRSITASVQHLENNNISHPEKQACCQGNLPDVSI
jgi:hypothetical protein